MAKYVQNVHIANVKCKIEVEGQLVAGRRPFKEIIFRPYAPDRRDGRQGDTGYTELSDADYKALTEQSKLFTSCVEKKLLVVYDDLPDDAKTPYDMLQAARREIVSLNARIVELESAGSGSAKPGKKLEEANTKIEGLTIDLNTAREENARLQKLIGAIDPAVVDKAAESAGVTQF